MFIKAPTCMDAWKLALSTIIKKGEDFKDDNNRTCREILNLTVTIENPELDIDSPMNELKKINKWIYPSKEELANIVFNKELLPLYEYNYGNRMFNFEEKLNQFDDYIIPLLRKNPTSRRATIIVMNPLQDFSISSKNSPAIISLQFKIKNNKLLITAVVRSNDFFIGWPANLYQISLLQKYVADKLELGIGSITSISLSAHVFEEYFEDINQVLEK